MRKNSFNSRARSNASLRDDPWKALFLSPAFSLMATLQSATLQADEEDEAAVSHASSSAGAVVHSLRK